MHGDIKIIIEQFVDYLLPDLTPSETSLYLYLLCNSFVKNNSFEVRVGKRTIATKYGKGSRGEKTNYEHVSKTLKMLEGKGCIKIKDTNREGTLYIVNLPKDIPLVAEKIASLIPQDTEEDYFNDPEKRRKIFERDKWICQYCGEKVTQENATIDHFIPQSKGGKHNKENLKLCCFICNSIKSGKSYKEAAPFLLKSLQERKARSHTKCS
jgi:5-methylcytosine-specific restriction endonuclease McrA